MEAQIIETLNHELDNIKHLINDQNISEQEGLQAGLKFLSLYIKSIDSQAKTAEAKISYSLIDALTDVNTKDMSIQEWMEFGTYLHEMANLLLKSALKTAVKGQQS